MRYILVIAILLLAACDPVYLERQGNAFTPYRPAAARYSARDGQIRTASPRILDTVLRHRSLAQRLRACLRLFPHPL